MAIRTKTFHTSRPKVDYPDSDGQPMGETGIHVSVILTLLDVLRRYYRGNPNVAVLANMFLYYVEEVPIKNVSPDLFVTFGVPANPNRRTFKVWEELKCPDLVIEISSSKTRGEDQNKKFRIYRDKLKVREYFLFDPEEEYLDPSLQGFRLVGKHYVPIAEELGRLPSEILGLHLERDGLDLRLHDPRTGRWLTTSEEIQKALVESEAVRRREATARRREATARRNAEAAQRNAEAAQRSAEAEADRLRAELNALMKRMREGS